MERTERLLRGLELCGEGGSSVERVGVLGKRAGFLWRGLDVFGEGWRSVERSRVLWRGLNIC